jgi:DNA-directed RNA polymerase subunit E'/Rpb7|tara:strand:+ start:892 stop:1464 length:573 start_codon:yes stop_codon:yes gene_type:complete
MSGEFSKAKKSVMRKRGVGIYQKNILFKQIAIPFNKIGNNISELINLKLSNEIEGKCIDEGFIKNNSINLLNYSSGEVRSDNVLFTVTFECLTCRPVEGQRFRCIVKNITKAGIRAETDEEHSPVVVFIARDHHHSNETFSELKVNDSINMKVIGIRYELNDKYISVIGEYVETKKFKKKPNIKIVIKDA